MKPSCDIQRLERLVLGELDRDEEAAVQAHVAGCRDCTGEWAWLRAEHAMFARRADREAPLPAALWEATFQRIQGQAAPVAVRRRPAWQVPALVSACAACAAWLAFAPVKTPSIAPAPLTAAQSTTREHARLEQADEAIVQAEESYAKAASLLEAEYAAGRQRLDPEVAAHYDEMLATTRVRLALARHEAGTHPEARLRVLDGYAQYVRTLQSAVFDLPEATP